MQKTLVDKLPIAIPKEIAPYVEGAKVYDSSCNSEAKVYFIERDEGYFLKVASKCSLQREALMTNYFYSKGIGAEFLFYRPVEFVGEEESFSVNENIPISLQKYYMMISTGSGFFEYNEYNNAWNRMVDGSVDDPMAKIRVNKSDMEKLFSEEFVFDGDRYGGDYLTLDSLYIGTKRIYSFEHTDENGEKWLNYLFYFF